MAAIQEGDMGFTGLRETAGEIRMYIPPNVDAMAAAVGARLQQLWTVRVYKDGIYIGYQKHEWRDVPWVNDRAMGPNQ